MHMTVAPSDDGASFGLASHRTRPSVMTVAHRHDDIELNFASAEIDYLIDGVRTTIPAQTLVAFWAARPHQLVAETSPPWLHWLTVPLQDFLSFALSPTFVSALLRGEIMALRESSRPSVETRLLQWRDDLALGTPENRAIVELELHAYLRRASGTASAINRPVEVATESRETAASRAMSHAAVMAEFISQNAAFAITVDDVARAAHLHPNHAMTVFRRSMGITIGDYLALSRVARAQRLLITTTDSVTTIGHAAGFRSTSQFYERFGKTCGMSPAAYRRMNGAARSLPSG